MWTDEEVGLLLRVTLDYRTAKAQENVDWESCQSKYADIALAFRQQYRTGDGCAPQDFPHDPATITKAQIVTKLKAVRGKYRKAVDAGRRSGFGRVIMVFYELCQDIWGGSPGTDALPTGIESGDLVEESAPNSGSTTDVPLSPASTADTGGSGQLSGSEINRRRSLLQVS